MSPIIQLHDDTRPYWQPALSHYCERNGIAVEAYSPLGRVVDLQAPAVVQTAQAYGVTPAQVILRWHIQHGHIIIPKSVHKERMVQNLQSADIQLTPEQMESIDALHSFDGRIGADPATFVQSQSWAEQHARGNV